MVLPPVRPGAGEIWADRNPPLIPDFARLYPTKNIPFCPVITPRNFIADPVPPEKLLQTFFAGLLVWLSEGEEWTFPTA